MYWAGNCRQSAVTFLKKTIALRCAVLCCTILSKLVSVFIAQSWLVWIFKGMILGGIIGMSASLWLCFGSLTVRFNYPLSPVSVEQCPLGNASFVFFPSSPNYTSSFEASDGIGAKYNWNQTIEALPRARSHAVSTSLDNAQLNQTLCYITTEAMWWDISHAVNIEAIKQRWSWTLST